MASRFGIVRGMVAVVALGGVLFAQSPAQSQGKPVVGASQDVFVAVSQFYAYDDSVPLRAEVIETRKFPSFTREKIVFTGVRHSRVPAYLAVPTRGTGPFPVVMLIDGVTGAKERWFTEDSWPHGPVVTNAMIEAGMAVMALDARYHGERAAENDYRAPRFSARPHDRDMIMQTIVEHRRAVDYLATRSEIDENRVGLLGLSMGGVITFALSAMEPRVKAGVASVTPIESMKETIAIPISPMTFAPSIDVPFLMLMGRTDTFYTIEDSGALLSLIKSPRKELEVYDAGHRLPPEYAARGAEWLKAGLQATGLR